MTLLQDCKMLVTSPELTLALLPSIATVRQEKTKHALYLSEFRTQQCSMFLEHKCQYHRPYTCFCWHFPNQKRRQPFKQIDGTFNYNPDVYCTKYDENSGICPNGDECPYVHRNAGDTERRYHPRYFKTGNCIYETTEAGACVKNGQHCAFAHGPDDIRLPVYDIREVQDATAQHSVNLPASLEKERVLSEDPKWNDMVHVLAYYKTEACKKPPRMCRQGYACPFFHNGKDKRRNPRSVRYRSTPCPQVKPGDEWRDSSQCDSGDNCTYCHTRTEQQFHPEIYKSTKCNDMVHNGYCPRGPFCAFAHVDTEMNIGREFLSTTTGGSSCSASLYGGSDSAAASSLLGCGVVTPTSSTPAVTTSSIIDGGRVRHFSGGSLSSESGLSSSSARGDTPPTFSTGIGGTGMISSNRFRHIFDQPFTLGMGVSITEDSQQHVESIMGHALDDSYNLNSRDLCELNSWPDEQNQQPLHQQSHHHQHQQGSSPASLSPNCAGTASTSSTLRSGVTAPVLIPRSHRHQEGRDFSSAGSSSGLGGSFPGKHHTAPFQPSCLFDKDNLGSTGFLPTSGRTPSSCSGGARSRQTSGSPTSGFNNLPQSPILMQSAFSNAPCDLQMLALHRDLEDSKQQLTTKQSELESAKQERDQAMVQLHESMQIIRSLVQQLGGGQSSGLKSSIQSSESSLSGQRPTDQTMKMLMDALQQVNMGSRNSQNGWPNLTEMEGREDRSKK